MRPIQLVMTAFGPYKQREVIDFHELGEHRLFSISGNTGAGKTTIFDAICYALYGEASGEERSDVSMMRSHFADDNVYTAVELTFCMKDQTYQLIRQMAHKKAGNKTATGGSVEFYEFVGEEKVPFVDRFHVTDVNKKVEELIGLTKHQFSQIVMLPQGEFRKLLTSETENKEEILRRIFKTDRYKFMRDVLDQKRKVWKETLQDKQKEREIHFRHALQLPIRESSLLEKVSMQEHMNSYQMVEALEEELQFYLVQLERLEQDEKEHMTLLKKQEELYHVAKAINDKLAQLQVKEDKHTELLAKRTFIENEEVRLKRAEEAERLAPFEVVYQEASKSANQAEVYVVEMIKKQAEIKQQFEQAHARYMQEKEKESLREETKRKLQTLEELRSIVETLAEREQQLIALKHQTSEIETKRKGTEQQLDAFQQEKKIVSDTLRMLEDSLKQYVGKVDELNRMRDHAKVLKQYQEAMKEAKQLELEATEAKAVMVTIQNQYQEMEEKWLSEQAGQLAIHLHDEMPCPVCGSIEHPKKATVQTHFTDEQVMNKLKSQKEQAETAYFRAEQKWNVSQESCRAIGEQVETLGYHIDRIDDEYDMLVQTGKQLAADVKTLQQNEAQRTKLQPELQKLEQSMEVIMQNKQQFEAKLHELQMEQVQQQTSYEYDKKKLSADVSDITAWKQQYQVVTAELRILEEAWRAAEEVYQRLQNEMIRVEADRDAAMREQEKLIAQKNQKYEAFINSLQEAGFLQQEAYEAAKLSTTQRQELQQMIQAYYSSIEVLTKQIEELRQEVQGKAWTNVDELAVHIEELQRLVKSFIEQRQNMKSSVEGITKLKNSIIAIDHEIREEEAMFQELVDLYEVIKGDNESRLSFERYILIEYLEQIVQAANERLRKLSNGQFSLKRSERIEKRNRQSGLGLDVYDSYTGQTRDVKTLSGGEKFNASLSLALGMADVIQSYEGGISIETMFIDEGFGSLDEESLTKAIDTLIDLQKSGRLIGVISHVQELKNALPAVLEVSKQKDGCSKARFIIK